MIDYVALVENTCIYCGCVFWAVEPDQGYDTAEGICDKCLEEP